MANSTARYRFEFRVFDWAENLSRSLTGGRRAFFIGLRSDGSIRRIYFARPRQSFDGERKEALAESHSMWLLFSPHEEPGAGYVEWLNLGQPVAERWLARCLDPADFMDVRSDVGRDGWPTNWRVIIG